jgi:hypothetical protein
MKGVISMQRSNKNYAEIIHEEMIEFVTLVMIRQLTIFVTGLKKITISMTRRFIQTG